MKYEKLKSFLSKYVFLGDLEWAFCEQFIQKSSYKKGEIVHHCGDVLRKLFFVNYGVLRSYLLDIIGNDFTWVICFNDENASVPNIFAVDYDSLLNQTPSNFTIEVLEDCELFWINYDVLEKLYNFSKKYERLGRLLAENGYVYAQKRVIDMTIKSSIERYENFIELHNHLLSKVPQYYIASYLKISPQHLSSIKQKIKISE